MKEETRQQLSLTHSYLDVALAGLSPLSGAAGCAPTADLSAEFARLSLVVIFSHLALESFINYHFYRVYLDSRHAHERCGSCPGVTPIYSGFFDNYGNVPLTALRPELKEKINEVCDAYEIPRIPDKAPRLWQHFCCVLTPTRDFLVHPVPEHSLFQQRMRNLMEKNPAHKYIDIVVRIMCYFYEQTQTPLPLWLTGALQAVRRPLVGGRNTKRFHVRWCSSVKQMSLNNTVQLETPEEARAAGYVPCSLCNP